MGQIYAQAVKVLACVGHHEHHSDDLAKLLRTVKTSCGNVSDRSGPLTRAREGWFDESDYKTKATVEGFITSHKPREYGQHQVSEAFVLFSRRYYWTRQWIIQEVALAKHLEILCASDAFSRSDIYLLHWIASCCFSRINFHRTYHDHITIGICHVGLHHFYNKLFPENFLSSNFYFVLSRNSTDRIPALDIFSRRRSLFGCSRPEDRVYGMLSLVEWPKTEPPIQVDPVYRPSATFDLAELLLSFLHCSSDNIDAIFKALEICHDLDEMKYLVAARCSLPSGHEEEVQYAEDSKYAINRYDFEIWDCDVISKSNTNHLTAVLERQELLISDPPIMLEMTKDARRLYVGSDVAALLCSGASEGDLIIPTNFGQSLLVLRNNSCGDFDIVGQGLLVNEFRFPYREDFYPPEAQARCSRYWFSYYLQKHKSLLRASPKTYETDLDLCMNDLSEILNEELSLLEQKSTSWSDRATLIDSLWERAWDIKELEKLAAQKPHPCGGLVPFDLALHPLDMLLLGCQDLEKDGSRNESKMMQRLSTPIQGTAFKRPIEKSGIVSDLDLN